MRFPTVLFDLDGTVVDSGAIILASMRHATREVLGREYSGEELLRTVGGPGLEAQMHAIAPEHEHVRAICGTHPLLCLSHSGLRRGDSPRPTAT